jgi:hypothetical protein
MSPAAGMAAATVPATTERVPTATKVAATTAKGMAAAAKGVTAPTKGVTAAAEGMTAATPGAAATVAGCAMASAERVEAAAATEVLLRAGKGFSPALKTAAGARKLASAEVLHGLRPAGESLSGAWVLAVAIAQAGCAAESAVLSEPATLRKSATLRQGAIRFGADVEGAAAARVGFAATE